VGLSLLWDGRNRHASSFEIAAEYQETPDAHQVSAMLLHAAPLLLRQKIVTRMFVTRRMTARCD
jgi:hypothetical protein